jgi:hypothetical protein
MTQNKWLPRTRSILWLRCGLSLFWSERRLAQLSESELFYDWRFTANQFVLATSPLRLTTCNFIFQLNTCGYNPYVRSSLTRGWVCRSQLVLVLSSAVIHRSESRGTHDHIYCLRFEIAQPGGPGSHICIPQEQVDPVITPGTRFPFGRLLRLAGLRWMYSIPPPSTRDLLNSEWRLASCIAYQYPRKRILIPQQRAGFQESISVETSFIFVSQETCSVTSYFPRTHLHGNVVFSAFRSNGSAC